MNTAHLHLILNHIPILGAFFGTVILIAGLLRKNNTLLTTSLWIFVIVAAASSGAFFTGEGAEEVVENAAGVSESYIEAHEDASAIAYYAMLFLGGISAVLLFVSRKKPVQATAAIAILVVSLIVNGLMFRSGWLGGKIRHDEIRGTATTAVAPAGEAAQESEEEDD